MNEEKIKVVLVKPMQKPEIVEIGTDLKSMQEKVGGLIEAAYYFKECVALVCNEEGKINSLPLNRAIKDEKGKIIDIVAGDFFICDGRGENFGSLSDEQLKRYSELFKNPERFYNIGGEIRAIPVSQPRQVNHER